MRWIILVLLVGCSSAGLDEKCEWSWMDEEGCLMDTCDLQLQADDRDHSWSECRDGQCWCCLDEGECWYSGHDFPVGADGDS